MLENIQPKFLYFPHFNNFIKFNSSKANKYKYKYKYNIVHKYK